MVKTEFQFFWFALVACTGKLQKKPVRLSHKYQPGIVTRFWCFPPALKPGYFDQKSKNVIFERQKWDEHFLELLYDP